MKLECLLFGFAVCSIAIPRMDFYTGVSPLCSTLASLGFIFHDGPVISQIVLLGVYDVGHDFEIHRTVGGIIGRRDKLMLGKLDA